MKLQLDTVNKTIKIEESVNLNELFEFLNKILPEVWKQFKLEVNTVINWTNPIYIREYPTWPTYPWWRNPLEVTYTADKAYNAEYLSTGTFNVEY